MVDNGEGKVINWLSFLSFHQKLGMLVMLRKLFLSVAAPALLLSSLQAATAMPLIVSHRGESKDAPENTMAAFRLAV